MQSVRPLPTAGSPKALLTACEFDTVLISHFIFRCEAKFKIENCVYFIAFSCAFWLVFFLVLLNLLFVFL